MSNRTKIENMIDRVCDLDDQYARRIRDGSMTPAMKTYLIRRIRELESALWVMDLNHDDLIWFSNRPLNGINRIGDPYYDEDLS